MPRAAARAQLGIAPPRRPRRGRTSRRGLSHLVMSASGSACVDLRRRLAAAQVTCRLADGVEHRPRAAAACSSRRRSNIAWVLGADDVDPTLPAERPPVRAPRRWGAGPGRGRGRDPRASWAAVVGDRQRRVAPDDRHDRRDRRARSVIRAPVERAPRAGVEAAVVAAAPRPARAGGGGGGTIAVGMGGGGGGMGFGPAGGGGAGASMGGGGGGATTGGGWTRATTGGGAGASIAGSGTGSGSTGGGAAAGWPSGTAMDTELRAVRARATARVTNHLSPRSSTPREH